MSLTPLDGAYIIILHFLLSPVVDAQAQWTIKVIGLPLAPHSHVSLSSYYMSLFPVIPLSVNWNTADIVYMVH